MQPLALHPSQSRHASPRQLARTQCHKARKHPGKTYTVCIEACAASAHARANMGMKVTRGAPPTLVTKRIFGGTKGYWSSRNISTSYL